MLEFTNPNEMSREHFDQMISVHNLEKHREISILGLHKSILGDIEKGEADELSEERKAEIDLVKAELNSLQRVVVCNDDLTKSIYYVREAQVEFSGNVEKDEEGFITKAEKGSYLDTELNRTLGRVGKEYGVNATV